VKRLLSFGGKKRREAPMLDLNDFYYFVQVVDHGGFTAAARSLQLPKSTLSYRIQKLEEALEARLLNRTSRQFGVTDVGEEFYRHSVAMLDHAERAEFAIKKRLGEPFGTVRITTGVAVAQFAILDMIADFVSRFPKVNLVQHVTDRPVDILTENFDVAIRAHSSNLPDSSLISRTLAPIPWYLFASPSYLEVQGTPKQPDDLFKHSSLFMVRGGLPTAWRLHDLRQKEVIEKVVPLSPRLASNDVVTLKNAAARGLGIVALPGYVCKSEVLEGRLVRVLPEWSAGEASITALIPHRLGSLPSIRAFVDYLAAEFPKKVAFC
jgi:DNA-binding transcriptional LysR family regulator